MRLGVLVVAPSTTSGLALVAPITPSRLMLSSAGARRTLAPVIALLKVPSSEQKIRSSFGIPDQRRGEPSTLGVRSIILLFLSPGFNSILLFPWFYPMPPQRV